MIDNACIFQIKGTILEELVSELPLSATVVPFLLIYIGCQHFFGEDNLSFEENCVALKACLNQTIHHNTYKSIQGFSVNSVLQMIIVLLSCFQLFHH